MEGKKTKLAKNTIIFLIGSMGSKIVQFFLVPLYTYTMSRQEFGNADIILTTINFLMPIFSLQLSDGLLRFGLDKKVNREELYGSTFKILFICSTFSIVLSPILNSFDNFKNFIFFFVLILNLRIYRDILSIMLKVEDKNKIFSVDSIIYSVVLSVSAIIFLSPLKLGINGYFLSYVIANLVSIIYILINLKLKLGLNKKLNKKFTRQFILYSLPMIINSLSYWITTASDKYMINIILTTASVGIYAIATKIPTIVSTFTGIFNQAWMISSISEYENDRDVNFYNEIFSLYCSASFIICALLILLIKPFMNLYVSPEYYEAWSVSSVLVVSAVFSGLAAFINGIFYAYKKNISATITTFIGALLNIILNFILIPKYEIMGAGIATLISWIFISTIRIVFIKKIINLNINLKKNILATGIIIVELLTVNCIKGYLAYIINVILTILILALERKQIKQFWIAINTKFKIGKNMRNVARKLCSDKEYRKRIKNKNFTILCSNCTAGIIYNDLGMKFLTPTINLYFSAEDFIKFCSKLDYYLNCNPKEKKTNRKYPVMEIDDITLYGVHYKNFEELSKKWNERKKRINKNNLFIMMTERDRCTYSNLIEFDKLNYKNKIVFTHKKIENIKSSFHVKGTENNGKDKDINPTKSLTDYKSRISPFRYIDDFDFVGWLNEGENQK